MVPGKDGEIYCTGGDFVHDPMWVLGRLAESYRIWSVVVQEKHSDHRTLWWINTDQFGWSEYVGSVGAELQIHNLITGYRKENLIKNLAAKKLGKVDKVETEIEGVGNFVRVPVKVDVHKVVDTSPTYL